MIEDIKKKARRVLGVSDEEDIIMIRQAYRELAKIYHPDHNQNSQYSVEKFKLIAEAYEILSGEKNDGRYGILKTNTDIVDEPTFDEKAYWEWWMERYKGLF